MRWWIAVVILAVSAASLITLRLRETLFFEQIALGIIILTLLALGFWYVFLTGMPWTRRFLLASVGAALVAGVVVGVAKLTRVEGSVGGSGVPRLVWKWSPPKDASLGRLEFKPSVRQPPDVAQAIESSSYPQFLGPDRLGVITGVPLARDWEAQVPERLWRQPIGLGWSAFAVSEGRAFTQEQRGEHELVVCYDLLTGRPTWAHTNAARFSEALGGVGPRATPTCHQDRVFAMGATGILDCLDPRDGRLIWSREVLHENGLSNITWGKSCSPLIHGDLVIVTGGDNREKALLAYRWRDGKPVWQAGRDQASYCSPMVATLDGQQQILVVNGGSVTGHDPKDGTILWEHPWPGKFPKVTQPLVVDTNRVFIAAGYDVGCALLRVERNATGAWTVTELWKNRNLKPKFCNLVRRGDLVYGLDDGIMVCLDLTDGKRRWKDGRYGHGQILMVDDLLIVQAESGDVALVQPDPAGLRELTRFAAIKGKTWNNPALAGRLLLARNDEEAACYRLPISASASGSGGRR